MDVAARKLGSMVRVNGLFHLLVNGIYIYIYIGVITYDIYNPLILTFDPNFQPDIQVCHKICWNRNVQESLLKSLTPNPFHSKTLLDVVLFGMAHFVWHLYHGPPKPTFLEVLM